MKIASLLAGVAAVALTASAASAQDINKGQSTVGSVTTNYTGGMAVPGNGNINNGNTGGGAGV